MATDSKTAPNPPGSLDAPIIENEIPAYRAISAGAVTSLILGGCSVFCFTSPWFLLVVAASVFFGWRSLRTIRRLPEILTGTGFAKTGIGLALVFGLASTAQLVVQDLMLTYEATQFAKNYVEVLKSQPVDLAIWYRQNPDYRHDKQPATVVEDLKKAKDPSKPDVYAAEAQPILSIKEKLQGPKQEIHFSKIESKLVDGVTYYANALVDIDGPDGEQFALLEMSKAPNGGMGDWKIREIRYPYKPASLGVQAEKKADDDGHGH